MIRADDRPTGQAPQELGAPMPLRRTQPGRTTLRLCRRTDQVQSGISWAIRPQPANCTRHRGVRSAMRTSSQDVGVAVKHAAVKVEELPRRSFIVRRVGSGRHPADRRRSQSRTAWRQRPAHTRRPHVCRRGARHRRRAAARSASPSWGPAPTRVCGGAGVDLRAAGHALTSTMQGNVYKEIYVGMVTIILVSNNVVGHNHRLAPISPRHTLFV
jgi:hypothetical protein